jgi:hypothetical protein
LYYHGGVALRALVGEVWPYRIEGLSYGSDLVLHVVRGTIEPGDLVNVQVGTGQARRVRVEAVSSSDPAAAFVEAKIALPGQPPPIGARLEVRCPELSPSEVTLMGTVASGGNGADPLVATAPPVCAWAAVFDLLASFEDGLALVALLEEEAALLANGEPPDYFLGCLASDRAVAAVVADRMRALSGGGEAECSGTDFLRTTRGAVEPTAEERRSFADRLRSAGIELSAPD